MKSAKLTKGILIAVEGVDGAGKTTQAEYLRDYFARKGYKTHLFKEPTKGKYGLQIRELAAKGRDHMTPEQEFELFLKDRKEDCELNIKPALDNHDIVFMDRYYFSSMAYQGALGMDMEYIRTENEKIAIVPDLVIIFDLAVKIGLSRIRNNRNETPNHFEKESYLEDVRKNFLQMSAPYIQRIDAADDEDTVSKKLVNIIKDVITPYIVEDTTQQDLFSPGGTFKISKN